MFAYNQYINLNDTTKAEPSDVIIRNESHTYVHNTNMFHLFVAFPRNFMIQHLLEYYTDRLKSRVSLLKRRLSVESHSQVVINGQPVMFVTITNPSSQQLSFRQPVLSQIRRSKNIHVSMFFFLLLKFTGPDGAIKTDEKRSIAKLSYTSCTILSKQLYN